MTEAEWQQQVIDLAHACGWQHLHIRRSIGKGKRWTTTTNIVGWPDLVLMRPPDGLLFVELKTEDGKVSPEQSTVLDFLDRFAFASAHVWRPSDLNEAKSILSRRSKP